jgi:4-amino-4-deoxy-L-arabinose transferase-like glycosyltransferase
MNRPRFLSSAALALAILAALTALIVLRQVGNNALAYPDADRLLLDGVFMLDFMREMPVWPPRRIYDFTVNYYAQYPGLSIGYKPIFFPTVEAAFNGIFGISPATSRLALLLFAFVAVAAFFDLVRERFGVATAFWASAVFITAPSIAKWGWYTMTELPTLAMVLLSGWLMQRYLRSGKHAYLYATAVAFGLACWTKQVAIFAVIWFLLAAVASGRLLLMLRQTQTYVAGGLALVLLVPLLVVTLWLGDLNIQQSLGRIPLLSSLVPTQETLKAPPAMSSVEDEGTAGSVSEPSVSSPAAAPRTAPPRWRLPFDELARNGLPPWTLALAGVGLLLAIVLRERRVGYFLWLAIAVYVFFGLMLGVSRDREYIYWIPVFALFAVLPFTYLAARVGNGRQQYVISGLLALLVVSHVALVYSREPVFSHGYDVAAGFVVSQSESPTVLVDAYNNGYFTYFVRQYDEDRNVFVLRADKLLSSSGMYGGDRALDAQQHMESEDELAALIDRFGVQFIVVESKSPLNLPIHDLLRTYLRSDERFRLAATIPIRTNREPLQDQSLLVYENMRVVEPEGGMLELPVPIVGKTIRVQFKRNAAGAAVEAKD